MLGYEAFMSDETISEQNKTMTHSDVSSSIYFFRLEASVEMFLSGIGLSEDSGCRSWEITEIFRQRNPLMPAPGIRRYLIPLSRNGLSS